MHDWLWRLRTGMISWLAGDAMIAVNFAVVDGKMSIPTHPSKQAFFINCTFAKRDDYHGPDSEH